ncbi:hypothetical protein GCM10010222_21910 [Streptomyces tanashiensis]|nr:hypothetical protein GCM10010222_21910 [Streptomyces tanashiensis]
MRSPADEWAGRAAKHARLPMSRGLRVGPAENPAYSLASWDGMTERHGSADEVVHPVTRVASQP